MNYPSFEDFLDKKDERGYSVVNERINGKTLEEIAIELGGITRERVRQIENKYMRKVLGKISLEDTIIQESTYKYIYETYDLSNDFFRDYLRLSNASIYYLNYLYQKDCKIPAIEALDNIKIPSPLRLKIESYVFRNYVKIENHYVPARRGFIEDALLPVFAREDISFDDFINLVNEYVIDIGMPEFVIQSDSFRGRYNKLSLSKKVLTKYNQMMIYYEILSRDYKEFYDTLNLNQFSDIEISAKKLFDENEILMKDYDIHDEYELHNLIKKTLPSNEYSDIDLKRTPIIRFGNANREEQVKDLLIELAPIEINEFSKAYSEKYGVYFNTVSANFLKCIKQYNNHGVFEISAPPLSFEELEYMKSVLTDEFYLTDTIKEKFREKYPDLSLDKINHYSIRQLGFIIYNGYVISDKYRNAAEYFDYLLTKEDIINISEYKYGITQTNSFCSRLRKLKENYDIIEFSKHKYINIKRITEMTQLTKSDLQSYCENVKKYVANNFFTIASIHSENFTDNLETLGFEDYFYSSIIKEDIKDFTSFRIGNGRVFRTGNTEYNFSDFIEWILYQNESLSMSVYDMIDVLSEKYNIVVEKHKIRESLLGTSMYYNELSEKIYADYEVYFDEI